METGGHLNIIVITTINAPSKAVRAFANLAGYELVVVGDRKTPASWALQDAHFLGLETQNRDYTLGPTLPENHYCRKMVGYEHAIRLGASVIIDTDDDNVPVQNYAFPTFCGQFQCYEAGLGFINPYHHFTTARIWPRGLPLDLIARDDTGLEKTSLAAQIGVWQGLADGEPDVDAIYRLVGGGECMFEQREPVALPEGTVAPFNSQNTAFCREMFPLLYLPSRVTFRFTDILRGLIAQPIMWKHGYLLGFAPPSVLQERNPHDNFDDFLSEIPMYRHCRAVVDIAAASCKGLSLSEDLWSTYQALCRAEIVPPEELATLEVWLRLFDH